MRLTHSTRVPALVVILIEFVVYTTQSDDEGHGESGPRPVGPRKREYQEEMEGDVVECRDGSNRFAPQHNDKVSKASESAVFDDVTPSAMKRHAPTCIKLTVS
jgi:hypothetical protein